MGRKSRKGTWFVSVLVLAAALMSAQAGWSATATVNVFAFTTAAPFTATLAAGDGAKLTVGQIEVTPFADTPTITNITGDVITLSSQILPSTIALPKLVVFGSPVLVPGVAVNVFAFTTAAPFTATVASVPTNLAPGQVELSPFGGTAAITGITGNVISLTSQILPSTTALPAQVVFGVPSGPVTDFYQVNYLPAQVGGGIAGGYIDISNAGELGADAFGPLSGTTGRICVNVYVFTADEQESECCSCLVTPNALVHLSASDLIGNPGNGVTPTLGTVVKLLATIPGTTTTAAGLSTQTTFTGSACNAALPFTAANLAPGMVAWGTKFHSNTTTTPASVSLSETQFSNEALSLGELTKLTNLCQFLAGNQSGAGLCKACSLGGLGAGRR